MITAVAMLHQKRSGEAHHCGTPTSVPGFTAPSFLDHLPRPPSHDDDLAQGFGLQDVKDLLGHSSIVLTSNTYGHVLEARQREVAGGWTRCWEANPSYCPLTAPLEGRAVPPGR
jgi:hypothetical protein